MNTSSAGLTELELGLGFELSARIELELELFFQLRPWRNHGTRDGEQRHSAASASTVRESGAQGTIRLLRT